MTAHEKLGTLLTTMGLALLLLCALFLLTAVLTADPSKVLLTKFGPDHWVCVEYGLSRTPNVSCSRADLVKAYILRNGE